jgi:3-dehydroquinate dehydratase-1
MRLQSQVPVKVRDKLLGGPVPLICLPLVATDQAALLQQAAEVTRHAPDMIEWRVDKFARLETPALMLTALAALREAIGETPLIFTCRVASEGGFRELAADTRLELNLAAMASGQIDLLDTEMVNGPAFIDQHKAACGRTGVKLILSYHNFQATPEGAFLVAKLREARQLGADIAKIAVMPASYGDVLTLLSATYQARRAMPDTPLITMAMGAEGAITRVAGGLFGADLTFAIGQASSAPGQIPIGDLRAAWQALKLY